MHSFLIGFQRNMKRREGIYNQQRQLNIKRIEHTHTHLRYSLRGKCNSLYDIEYGLTIQWYARLVFVCMSFFCWLILVRWPQRIS